MRVHYLQHVPFEGLGLIERWALKKAYSLSVTKFYDNATLPSHDDYDVLIILGGPMSIYDEADYPWLLNEKAWIAEAIERDKYVLGICLGAQLIASVLGAKVSPLGHQEIGWHPIAFTDNSVGSPLLSGLNLAMTVFHWHGETFAIPSGAKRLASSAGCMNQGFSYGHRVLALQFHLEMDEPTIDALLNACGQQCMASRYVQSCEQIAMETQNQDVSRALFRLLDNWLRAGA